MREPTCYPPGTDTRSRSVEVEIICAECGEPFGTPGFVELGLSYAHDSSVPCPHCNGDGSDDDSFDAHAEAAGLMDLLNARRAANKAREAKREDV